MKQLLLSLLVFVGSFFPLSNTHALSCLPPGPALPMSERVDDYNLIFVGEIGDFVKRSVFEESEDPFGNNRQAQFSIYQIKVQEGFKGVKEGQNIKLKTLSTAWHVWAYPDGGVAEYQKGDRYIVLANDLEGDTLTTEMNPDCSNDQILIHLNSQQKPPELEELRILFPSTEKKHEAPLPKSGGSWWGKVKSFFRGLFAN